MAKYFIRKCTAAVTAAFLLSAMSTIDRHNEHLNERVQLQMQHKNEASQQYVNAAYEAMVKRNATGDYGEVYE